MYMIINNNNTYNNNNNKSNNSKVYIPVKYDVALIWNNVQPLDGSVVEAILALAFTLNQSQQNFYPRKKNIIINLNAYVMIQIINRNDHDNHGNNSSCSYG